MRGHLRLCAIVVMIAAVFAAGCKRKKSHSSSSSDDEGDSQAELRLLSPNGGESWVVGDDQTVTWVSEGIGGIVNLEYTIDGATWLPLAMGTTNDGTASITVPSTPSATARVRVSEVSGSLTDMSDGHFSIHQFFEDLGAGLTGATPGSVAWGDYDSDGDLDLAMAGDTGSTYIARIYQNTAGVFTDISAGLTGVRLGSLAWGDYDNDGDLDLALAGDTPSAYITRIYNNAGGVFTEVPAGLIGIATGSLAWGDYDNDGDLDLAVTGYTFPAVVGISRIYRNTGGVFTDIAAGLPGLYFSSLAWGDYDNDGDLDLALAGYTGSASLSRIYENTGGVFTDITAGLPAIHRGSLAWGDYDNDGDLDLALAGHTDSVLLLSRIYRNSGGVFADAAAGLTDVSDCSLAWGDYDNDGDLDLALAGDTGSGLISRVYKNTGGGFTDITAGMAGVTEGSLAWGDCDNDGDLDLAVAGDTGSGFISRIYRNYLDGANAGPSVPGAAASPVIGIGTVTLSWTAPSDDHTPASGLSYNLRIGTTPGGSNRYASMANSTTGYRRIPWLGPRQTTSATLSLPGGTYYWSVQGVDSAWKGGSWATEGSFTIP